MGWQLKFVNLKPIRMSFLDYNMSDNATIRDYFGNPDTNQSFVSNTPQLSTMTSIVVNVTLPKVTRTNLLESLIVPLYGTIFLLSVVGNSLVLITLARNKRMRTVTNVYLLNLVSKLYRHTDGYFNIWNFLSSFTHVSLY